MEMNRSEVPENIHRLPTETCPMCEVGTGGVGSEPNDPVSLKIQIDNLERRRKQLRQGDLSARQIQELLPRMCPYCQDVLGGAEATSDKEEVELYLARLVYRLEERLAEYEHRP